MELWFRTPLRYVLPFFTFQPLCANQPLRSLDAVVGVCERVSLSVLHFPFQSVPSAFSFRMAPDQDGSWFWSAEKILMFVLEKRNYLELS